MAKKFVDARYLKHTLNGEVSDVIVERFDDGSEEAFGYKPSEGDEFNDHMRAIRSGEPYGAEEAEPLDSESVGFQEYRRRREAGES